MPTYFKDVICVDQADGTTLDTSAGRLYLVRLGGVRIKDGLKEDRTPAQVYAFSVDDLAKVIARLVVIAADNGDGQPLCDTLMRALKLDPEALRYAGAAMESYLRRN